MPICLRLMETIKKPAMCSPVPGGVTTLATMDVWLVAMVSLFACLAGDLKNDYCVHLIQVVYPC